MTHMTQYSYLDRVVPTGFLMLLYLWVIWSNDKFSVFGIASLKSGQTRPFIILLLLFSLLALFITDAITVNIKYQEGWTCFPNGAYKAAGNKLWSAENLAKKPTADAFWNMALIFKSSGCFLLNTMWGFICSGQFGGDPLPKGELIFCISASLLSVAIVFILQKSFPDDPFLSGVVPQYYVSCTLLMISAMTFISYGRFKKLQAQIPDGSAMYAQLNLYKRGNLYLAWNFLWEGILALFGVILPTLGVKAKVTDLHKNVFIGDFSTRCMNFCFLIGYILLLFLLYPPKLHVTTKGGDKSSKSKASKTSKVAPAEGGDPETV